MLSVLRPLNLTILEARPGTLFSTEIRKVHILHVACGASTEVGVIKSRTRKQVEDATKGVNGSDLEAAECWGLANCCTHALSQGGDGGSTLAIARYKCGPKPQIFFKESQAFFF